MPITIRIINHRYQIVYTVSAYSKTVISVFCVFHKLSSPLVSVRPSGPQSENDVDRSLNTLNVDIFALYIFSRYSRFINIRENIYIVKITFVIP